MKRALYWVSPFAILIAAVGLRLGQKRAEVNAQASQRAARLKAAPVVEVAPARVQDIVQTFGSVGTVEAPLSVNIAAKVSGRIEYLQVHEGDRATKGQVLVRIDSSEIEADVRQQQASLAEARYRLAQAQLNQNPTNVAVSTQVSQQQAGLASARADLAQAKAELTNAQSRYKRLKGLYDQGFVSAQEVDDAGTVQSAQEAAVEAAAAKVTQAEAALQYAEANTAQRPAYERSLAALRAAVAATEAAVSNAQAQRANTVLTAPLDGWVTGRYLDPGAMATPGQPILAVQYMREVWVRVPVPEEVSAQMRLGAPAQVTLDALPGRAFTGHITQINPSADPQSRQFAVRVALDNAGNLLRPGTFAHVTIETERVRDAVVVPREAVERGEGGASVVVVDQNSTARHRPVTLGASDTNAIAVTEGLTPGEKVVTLCAFPLKDGQQVSLGGERRGGAKGRGR
jgi:HlyD family secretion protein